MSEKLRKNFEQLNMTQEEVNRFTEAMKKEEFRKLLIEYAEEISDPKNRELYEQEISKLEEERGMNVTFIHPEPGYCIKTTQNENKKCFINICKNSNIEKPSSKRDLNNNNNKGGLYWQIPHTCSPPREDLDKSGKKTCVVYDVVFHPDAYRMGETNSRFNQLLKDSAIQTIEKNFNVKLDQVNLKVLKNLNFKGKPTACVIRKQLNQENIFLNEEKKPNNNQNVNINNNNNNNQDPIEKIIDHLKCEYIKHQEKKDTEFDIKNNDSTNEDNYIKPNYKIIYKGNVDIQDFSIQLDKSVVKNTRPKEMSISIELPLCKSSENINLDIFEKKLYLESNNPKYKLDLNLSYPVNEKESKAKFDKSKRCLNVNLPIIPFQANLNDLFDNNNHISEIQTKEEEIIINSLNETLPTCLTECSNNLEKKETDLKYLLLPKVEIKKYINALTFKVTLPNYNKESIKLKLEGPNILKLTCESLSLSGSYIQYYLTYFKFVELHDNQELNYNLIDSDNLASQELDLDKNINMTYLNDESFYFVMSLLTSNNEKNVKVYISDEPFENEKKIFEFDLESINEILNIKNNNSNFEMNSNDIIKKDFILNFDKIANSKEANDDDDNDDDDDDDDDDDKKVESELFGKILNKNIDKYQSSNKVNFDLDEINEESENHFNLNQESDIEKNYIENEKKKINFEDQNNKKKEDFKDNNTSNQSSLSSSTSDFSNEASTLSSSLNSTSINKIKGILKKPRSFSESESNFMASNNSNNDLKCMHDSQNDFCILKKCVSFNKQVVKNIFKPGSTISGMKKPNSNKNKKKNNKRKRTVSDPTHNGNNSETSFDKSALFRSRSVSESSDDSSGILSNSAESLPETDKKIDKENKNNHHNNKNVFNNANDNCNNNNNKNSNKSKKKNKSKINNNQKNDIMLNMEKMINMKNDGSLNEEKNQHTTSCAFKFKNKLINDLD